MLLSAEGSFLFTSESVTEGHPDKIADQISDAILDAVLSQDEMGRVACETLVTTGLVVVAVKSPLKRTSIFRRLRAIQSETLATHVQVWFDCDTCSVLSAATSIRDIANGFDTGGGRRPGSNVRIACNETPELMPLPIQLAHHLLGGSPKFEEVASYLTFGPMESLR